VQINSCLKSSFVCKVITTKKYGQFLICKKRKPSCADHEIGTFSVSKDKWYTKEDTGKSKKMHCTHFGMPKGTSQAEAMSNSEKIKLVALATVELSEGIRQSIEKIHQTNNF